MDLGRVIDYKTIDKAMYVAPVQFPLIEPVRPHWHLHILLICHSLSPERTFAFNDLASKGV